MIQVYSSVPVDRALAHVPIQLISYNYRVHRQLVLVVFCANTPRFLLRGSTEYKTIRIVESVVSCILYLLHFSVRTLVYKSVHCS